MSHVLNVIVSDRAGREFAAAVSGQGGADWGVRVTALRVSPVRLSCELALEATSARRLDDHQAATGDALLWADPASAELLDGATIDYQESLAGAGFTVDQPALRKTWTDPVAARLAELLEREVNPGIASHGGHVDLVDYRDGTAYVFMGGGCQGCGQANATLRDGIETRVKAALPEVLRIVDVTDHAAGDNPYY
jgi:Fe/S biogenesis protein NfuA